MLIPLHNAQVDKVGWKRRNYGTKRAKQSASGEVCPVFFIGYAWRIPRTGKVENVELPAC